jgi:5'-methylthioadenosine phosphorylase
VSDTDAGYVPHVVGTRLGVVIGSSLTANPLPVSGTLGVAVAGRDGRARTVHLDEHGDDVVVLMRHSAAGDVPAHLVDHHAHVRALCAAGCDRVLAIGSGGGLRAELGPGTVLVPDDFLALTTYPTFHTTTAGYRMAGFDATWRTRVIDAWRSATSGTVVDGGTYAMVQGPRFETRAEIRLLAQHADMVGMTIPAECVLAGEAGLRYAAVCKIDNLANGIAGHALEVQEYLDNAAQAAAALVRDLQRVVDALRLAN